MGSVFYFVGTASAVRRNIDCSQMAGMNIELIFATKAKKRKGAQRRRVKLVQNILLLGYCCLVGPILTSSINELPT